MCVSCTTEQDIPLLVQVTRLRFLRVHALLSCLNLHPSQYHLLNLLGGSDGLSQKEIASHLYIKPSTLTVMINRMIRLHLIFRKKDLNDKRIFHVFLTDEGRKILEQARLLLEQVEQETFADFTLQEKQQFDQMVLRMHANLRNALQEGPKPCHWC